MRDDDRGPADVHGAAITPAGTAPALRASGGAVPCAVPLARLICIDGPDLGWFEAQLGLTNIYRQVLSFR